MHYTNAVSTAISLAALAAPVSAFWRMSCPGRVMTARMDPIVNPGGISGHVHTISGGNAFNYTMNYATTQTSTCSSCPIKQDLSNYWVPNLYYRTQDGKFVDVPQAGDGTGVYGGMVVYYLQRGGPNNDPLKAFPKDFRMLAGNPYKRNYTDDFAGQAVSFVCLDYSGTSNYYNKLPDKPCPDGLRAQIFFPSCWDGVNLDPPDHMSHMAYPTQYAYDNGPCPASHPVHLISIFYEVIFSTAGFDWWTPDGAWQPFTFSTGDPTGYGFHGDFLNGWDVDALQNATDTCTNLSGAPTDCPVFDFFDDATSQGCIIPPTIAQPVTGTLDALPGCNPIMNSNASKQTCIGDTAKIGPAAIYYSNFTGWDYLGCATDQTSNRTMNDDRWWDNSVTIDGCMNYCGAKGYQYAGLEYATQCFCSNSIPADRAPNPGVFGNCFTPCAGNSSQVCGGAGRLSLYKLNGPYKVIGSMSTQIACPQSNGTNYNSTIGPFILECGLDRGGGDIGMKWTAQPGNITQCIDLCAQTDGCTFVSLGGSACYMKGGALRPAGFNSGIQGARLLAGTRAPLAVSSSTTTTTNAATAPTGAASGNAVVTTTTKTTTTAAQAPAGTYTAAPSCPYSNGTYYQSTSTGSIFLIECGIDHQGGDMAAKGVGSFQECIEACASLAGCVDISLSGNACYMKKTLGQALFGNPSLKGAKLISLGSGSASISTTATTSALATTVATTSSASSATTSVVQTTTTSSAAAVQTTTTSSAAAVQTTTTSSSAGLQTTSTSGSATTTASAASTAITTSSSRVASSGATSTSATSGSVSVPQKQVVSSTSGTSTTLRTAASSTTASPSSTATAAVCPQGNSTIFIDPTSGYQFFIECGIDHAGGDLIMTYVNSLEACIAACATTTGCVDVSLSGQACYMKKTLGNAVSNPGIKGAKLIGTSSTSAPQGQATPPPSGGQTGVTMGPPVARTASS